MRTIAIAFVLCLAGPAWALDIDAPARVEVFAADLAGKPVAGASVRLKLSIGEADRELAKTQTDADGRAEIKASPPAERRQGGLGWQCCLDVEREGFTPQTVSIQLFPGAILKQSVTLPPCKTTIIRVVDEAGKPLPALAIDAATVEDNCLYLGLGKPFRTDAEGQYRWVHAPSEKITISGHGWSRSVKDAPRVEISLTRPESPHWLEGRLLTADGKPAAGWFVVEATGEGWFSCGGLVIRCYTCSTLAPVGADGRFAAEVSSNSRLAAVSPEGTPLMFQLNPLAWPELTRRLTLTLPPVRLHKGRLLLPDGKPAAGFPIRAIGGSDCDASWELHIQPAGGRQGWGVPLASRQFRPIVTDAQGRYELPVYAGAATSYRTREEAWIDGRVDEDASVKVSISSTTPTAEELRGYTHTIIRVVDDSGKDLAKARASVANRDSSFSLEQFTDSRGIHLFTNSHGDFKINVYCEGWREFSTSIQAQGQAVNVTVPEANRFKPLKGKILDCQGRPADGVSITPFSLDATGNRQYMGIRSAPTNAKGEFSLPLPDECCLDLHRWDDTGNIPTMPGWARPQVTANDRDITIHLLPTGSCRVLLPRALESGNVYLTRVDANSAAAGSPPIPDWAKTLCFYPVSGMQDVSVSPCVEPGKYTLSICLSEPSADPFDCRSRKLLEEPVTVRPDQETLVDLRKRAEVVAAAPPAKSMSRITIRRDGKAASGTTVYLFWTEGTDDPRIAQWIAQLGDPRYQRRDEASKRLASAGKGAGALLRDAATDPNPEVRLRAESLLGELAKDPTKPVRAICADLADQEGTVNFELAKGRRYIVVAHRSGVAIGWTTCVGGTESATIDLRPTRQVRLMPAEPSVATNSQTSPPSDGRERVCYWSFADVSADAAMAVMHVLGYRADASGEGMFGCMRITSANVFILHDAPTGTELGFQTDQSRSAGRTRIRVGADTVPVIEVKLAPRG